MSNDIIIFGVFMVVVVVLLFLDLNHNKGRVVSFKEALIMTIGWVTLSMLMAGFLFFFGDLLHGVNSPERLAYVCQKFNHSVNLSGGNFEELLHRYRANLTLEYLSGYVVEYSLSIDNIFIIMLILRSFKIEQKNYHKLLFWGIFGAVLMRFVFIYMGAKLVQEFWFVLAFFGVFMVFTGIRMFITRNAKQDMDIEHHFLVRWSSKIFRVTKQFVSNKFFVKQDAKWFITPLFLALILIEFTDLVFALDSIPAIFGISLDPYIVFFSNIFAILGLRSMFFLIETVIGKFHYLKVGLSFILVFVGLKILLHDALDKMGFTTAHSLLVIVVILILSILFSIWFPKKEDAVK